jgi:hypothetical protein
MLRRAPILQHWERQSELGANQRCRAEMASGLASKEGREPAALRPSFSSIFQAAGDGSPAAPSPFTASADLDLVEVLVRERLGVWPRVSSCLG